MLGPAYRATMIALTVAARGYSSRPEEQGVTAGKCEGNDLMVRQMLSNLLQQNVELDR